MSLNHFVAQLTNKKDEIVEIQKNAYPMLDDIIKQMKSDLSECELYPSMLRQCQRIKTSCDAIDARGTILQREINFITEKIDGIKQIKESISNLKVLISQSITKPLPTSEFIATNHLPKTFNDPLDLKFLAFRIRESSPKPNTYVFTLFWRNRASNEGYQSISRTMTERELNMRQKINFKIDKYRSIGNGSFNFLQVNFLIDPSVDSRYLTNVAEVFELTSSHQTFIVVNSMDFKPRLF